MGTCLRCFAVILISPGGSPEHPHRRRRRSRLDIAAYRRYAIALAQRDVRHHGGVEHQCPFVDLPLLGKALCARIGAAHRLHALVARPAGARLVAGGSEIWRHERIKDVHLDPAGREGVPATFGGRALLADQPVDHALPVHRLHVDLEAGAFEQSLGHRR